MSDPAIGRNLFPLFEILQGYRYGPSRGQTADYHSVFTLGSFEALEEEGDSMAKAELVKLAPEKPDMKYDEKGDTLYIAFSPETVAADSELTENDALLRYKRDKKSGST